MSRLTRRRFLQSGAAFSAALSLGACSSKGKIIPGGYADDRVAIGHLLRDGGKKGRESSSRTSRVAIVGSGIAGLSTAWRLAREGVEDFVVYELGSQAGGTARGGVLAGHPHPWGAHYLPLPLSHQRSLVTLLQEMRLGGEIDAKGRLDAPMKHKVRAPQERVYHYGFWTEGLIPWIGAEEKEIAEWKRFEELVDAFARKRDARGRRAFELPVAHCGDDPEGLDGIDAQSWADAHGFRSPRVRWMLEYATRDDYGCFLSETSAWALLHYFAARLSPVDLSEGDHLSWPEGNQHLVSKLQAGLGERLQTGALALEARAEGTGASLRLLDAKSGEEWTHRCEHLVLACPQFVTARLLKEDPAAEARRSFRYAPWVVANLHFQNAPRSRGFELAWDNVLYDSPSLGYVCADHQRDLHARDRVWTWYQPLCGPDEAGARRRLLEEPWERWRERILQDLAPAHFDLVEQLERIEVWRWGHAMVKPVPGFISGAARRAAARPFGPFHFANADLGGLPLFEEAHWSGSRAAEEILEAMKREFESLL